MMPVNLPAALRNDRRQHTRVRFSLEVLDARLKAQSKTRDISPSGMFVYQLPYQLGDRVRLAVRFPDCDNAMQVAADVVRVENGAGVAVRFLHAGEAQAQVFRGQIVRLALAKTQPA
jgi:hypothetical protein